MCFDFSGVNEFLASLFCCVKQKTAYEVRIRDWSSDVCSSDLFEDTRSSTNRLVYRGIELIPGIQIGLIEATDADRDTLVGTASLRYGSSDRLEAEVRLPYLYRNDRIEVVQQRDEGIVRQIALREDGFEIGRAHV